MNIQLGGQSFSNVAIPLLWGKRAIVQDREKRISIISLEGQKAQVEILGDQPAPDIEYSLTERGYEISHNGIALYSFDPERRVLTGFALQLPECEIGETTIRIGNSKFSGNSISGFAVGIAVSENGMSIGSPLPEGLAEFVV